MWLESFLIWFILAYFGLSWSTVFHNRLSISQMPSWIHSRARLTSSLDTQDWAESCFFCQGCAESLWNCKSSKSQCSFITLPIQPNTDIFPRLDILHWSSSSSPSWLFLHTLRSTGSCLHWDTDMFFSIISHRLYDHPRAALAKYHRLNCVNQDPDSLTALEARNPKSPCRQGWFLLRTMRPGSLAC